MFYFVISWRKFNSMEHQFPTDICCACMDDDDIILVDTGHHLWISLYQYKHTPRSGNKISPQGKIYVIESDYKSM